MTIATRDLLDSGLAGMNFARTTCEKMLDSIPAEHHTHQPCADGNHALWIMGHLAWTDDAFLEGLGGQTSVFDDEWKALFKYGSTVSPNASDYPAAESLRDAMTERRAALISWFEGQSDEELMRELPEDWKSFAPTYAALMSSMAAHEGMHAGQLTVIRRSLKMPLLFG